MEPVEEYTPGEIEVHDVVGIDHAPGHRALIGIEDVDPTADSADLKPVSTCDAAEEAIDSYFGGREA